MIFYFMNFIVYNIFAFKETNGQMKATLWNIISG